MKTRIFSTLCLLVLFASAAVSQERYVRPVDEAKKDASFLAFRTRLIAAAERKDAAYIFKILDRNITSSFGGHDGIADFKEFWKINEKGSKFWGEFLRAIKNGGHFYQEGRVRTFTAPYSYSGFPEDLDSFEHSVIFGDKVNLRDAPRMDSKVIGSLSYNIVTIIGGEPEPGPETDADWYRIKTLGGKTGWMKAEYVRSPIDYRAGFQKKSGAWRMIFFVAGD